jgi:hypothetical protein
MHQRGNRGSKVEAKKLRKEGQNIIQTEAKQRKAIIGRIER